MNNQEFFFLVKVVLSSEDVSLSHSTIPKEKVTFLARKALLNKRSIKCLPQQCYCQSDNNHHKPFHSRSSVLTRPEESENEKFTVLFLAHPTG